MSSPSNIISHLKGKAVSDCVLFLDFDGTLAELSPDPDHNRLTPIALEALSDLQNVSWIKPIIISGRDHPFLRDRTNGLEFDLSCEHGYEFHQFGKKPMHPFGVGDTAWIETADAIMKSYVSNIPRSKIEKKSRSICWHYAMVDPSTHQQISDQIEQELKAAVQSPQVQLYHGKHVVELKTSFANKGKFVKWYLSEQAKPGVLPIAIGDDVNDEAMFEAVNQLGGVSIKVGAGKSAAQFSLESSSAVVELLQALAQL